MDNWVNDWKLLLRYGSLTTPFTHVTLLAEGTAGALQDGFECPPGRAVMSMKAWVASEEEAAGMLQGIGRQIGFTVTGDIQLYHTEPDEPPTDTPFGYDIRFTPFKDK